LEGPDIILHELQPCADFNIKKLSKGENGMQIRMTPEQMRTRSGEVSNQQQAFQEVVSRMQNIINELQTEWEGQAANSFAQQFNDLQPSFRSMDELLGDISMQLNQTAQAVEELDNEIASRFGVK